MATITGWNPFGVSLDITATASTVTRTSATQYTVKFSVSWETYYSGAATDFGMTASSGGGTATLNNSGTISSGSSSTFTGTFTVTKNVAATKSVTVTFTNFNTDKSKSATKTITLSVNVPAWTSYRVVYNTNGGSGSVASQVKWKDQALTLQSKPTAVKKTGYTAIRWNTTNTDSGTKYAFGASYTTNASDILYLIWQANTYTITFNDNGGSGGPGSATKTHDKALTISTTKVPTRTNYNFLGWGTSAQSTTATYEPGDSYTTEGNATLYAVWELAYYKPSVTNLKAVRCNTSGTEDDFGTSCKISFNYDICQLIGANSLSSIKFGVSSSDESYDVVTMDISGLNAVTGSVTYIINQLTASDGSTSTFDPDASYRLSVNIYDTLKNSRTVYFIDLIASKFPIDLLCGGNGIAFGMPATMDGVMEVGFQGLFREPMVSTDDSGSQFLISNSTPSTDTAFRAIRQDTGTEMFVGIGSGGVNHGVYSVLQGGWMLYADGDDTTNVKAPVELHLICANIFADGDVVGSSYIAAKGGFRLSASKSTSTSMNCLWNDGSYHDLVARSSDGLTSYIGPGSLSGYSTLTCLRGQTVRIYAHSGAVYLGSSGSTAVTSDKNLKTDIVDIDDKYADMFFKLQPKTFKYDNPEVKGHRDHVGFIAQDVEDALLTSGLTTEDFAGICIDEDVTINPNDDSSLSEEERKAGEIHYDKLYSLRYEEFIALNTHMIQKAYRIIDQQNEKINELEERLSKLEVLLMEKE